MEIADNSLPKTGYNHPVQIAIYINFWKIL